MTDSLQQAIERLQQMPEERQDLIAKLVLHEIEQDERWMQSTASHVGKLERLVDEIRIADGRGECEPLDADQL